MNHIPQSIQSTFRSARALFAIGALSLAGTASAQFVNGGFEDGNFTGWQRGSGYWSGEWPIATASYFPTGVKYNASYDASAVVTPGDDPIVGNRLNRVYSGNFAARVNNWSNDNSVSAIRQTVTNYMDSTIYFEWAAVLEDSHGATDSDNFTLTLTNDTKGITLYSAAFNSFSNGEIFNNYNGWYYTPWQVQSLDVSAYMGDTFTLSLLASDCPYGGHAGYAYLDGFGSVVVQPGPTNGAVPEPSTYGLMGAGALLGLVAWRRRRAKKA